MRVIEDEINWLRMLEGVKVYRNQHGTFITVHGVYSIKGIVNGVSIFTYVDGFRIAVRDAGISIESEGFVLSWIGEDVVHFNFKPYKINRLKALILNEGSNSIKFERVLK